MGPRPTGRGGWNVPGRARVAAARGAARVEPSPGRRPSPAPAASAAIAAAGRRRRSPAPRARSRATSAVAESEWDGDRVGGPWAGVIDKETTGVPARSRVAAGDGRGVLVAVADVIDATGSGDVDVSTKVAVPADGWVTNAASGRRLRLDASNASFYEGGDVVAGGARGRPRTRAAAIVGAYDAADPDKCGVAPACRIVSIKIGDSRLGTMETGAGLCRALVACRRLGVDLVNLSYGEAACLCDVGRFVELSEKLVRGGDRGAIFCSSAGNNGPALSTVGAPGATSSALLGIGAYVNPAMCGDLYAMRSPAVNPGGAAPGSAEEAHRGGVLYSFSSRGPSPDGGPGVSVVAPGGAVATPASDTSRVPPRAPGPGAPPGRGIYLRELAETSAPAEVAVSVAPRFQNDALVAARAKADFRRNVVLESTAPWVTVGEKLVLTHAGKALTVKVDPTQACAVGRGPATAQTFEAGAIARAFVAPPEGAGSATLKVSCRPTDASSTRGRRLFHVHSVQLGMQESYASHNVHKRAWLHDGDDFVYELPDLAPGRTLEVCLSQDWNSLEPCHVEATLTFKAGVAEAGDVVLRGTRSLAELDAHLPAWSLESVVVSPQLKLKTWRRPLRPLASRIRPCVDGERDAWPGDAAAAAGDGRREDSVAYELELDYEWAHPKDGVAATVGLRFAGDELVYDAPVEGQHAETMRDAECWLEHALTKEIACPVYSHKHAGYAGDASGKMKEVQLLPGERKRAYGAPPKEKDLPKDAQPGDVLLGTCSSRWRANPRARRRWAPTLWYHVPRRSKNTKDPKPKPPKKNATDGAGDAAAARTFLGAAFAPWSRATRPSSSTPPQARAGVDEAVAALGDARSTRTLLAARPLSGQGRATDAAPTGAPRGPPLDGRGARGPPAGGGADERALGTRRGPRGLGRSQEGRVDTLKADQPRGAGKFAPPALNAFLSSKKAKAASPDDRADLCDESRRASLRRAWLAPDAATRKPDDLLPKGARRRRAAV
ncbi:tripeptidyl-peptidase [Aureococcus anophagefferens]|nr:tripeptidyl-peptidase [Aureococcus anophagefferens]